MTLPLKRITKEEFKKWGDGFLSLLSSNEQNFSNKEREMVYLSTSHIKLGNTFVLVLFANKFKEHFSTFPSDIRNEKHDSLENRTFEEYFDYILEKVEEHHHARVNCTPNLVDLKVRLISIRGWAEEEKYKKKLLNKIHQLGNEEDYNFIWLLDRYFQSFLKIIGEDPVGRDISDEDLRLNPYFFEDFSQVIFRAKEKLDEERNSSRPLNIDEEKLYVDSLEKQQAELEKQKKELRDKLAAQGVSSTEKEVLERQLKSLQKSLQETSQKLEEERRKKLHSSDNNNELAIRLGIAAAVLIMLGCLIVLLVKSERRRKYY